MIRRSAGYVFLAGASIGIVLVVASVVLFWPEGGQAAAQAAQVKAVPEGGAAELRIAYPLDESLFPPDIAAPTFRWNQAPADADAWFVVIGGEGAESWRSPVLTDSRWTLPDELWEAVKAGSLEKKGRHGDRPRRAPVRSQACPVHSQRPDPHVQGRSRRAGVLS